MKPALFFITLIITLAAFTGSVTASILLILIAGVLLAMHWEGIVNETFNDDEL